MFVGWNERSDDDGMLQDSDEQRGLLEKKEVKGQLSGSVDNPLRLIYYYYYCTFVFFRDYSSSYSFEIPFYTRVAKDKPKEKC